MDKPATLIYGAYSTFIYILGVVLPECNLRLYPIRMTVDTLRTTAYRKYNYLARKETVILHAFAQYYRVHPNL